MTILNAVIRNKDHPEYGEATIPFPVKTEDYDEIMGMMEQLEIGNAVASDCYADGQRHYRIHQSQPPFGGPDGRKGFLRHCKCRKYMGGRY